MPPKTKFDRDSIVDAAFEVAEEKGFAGITARNVANKLHSSVAPIYVNFSTVDELVEAVVQRVFSISQEMLASQDGKSPYENMGKASLAFARKYPVFFRELSLQPNPYMASYETIENAMIEALADDESLQGWNLKDRRRLFLKMRIFQIGLSVLVANDQVPSWLDDPDVERLLFEVGDELVKAQEIKRKENSE